MFINYLIASSFDDKGAKIIHAKICSRHKHQLKSILHYLNANWISEHAIKVVISRGRRVEELAPQELPVQRDRRVQLLQLKRFEAAVR